MAEMSLSIPILVKSNFQTATSREDEMVIRPINGKDMFLNKTAKIIFDNVVIGSKSVQDIIDHLNQRYGNIDSIEEDVMEILEMLWKATLIKWKDNINPFAERNKTYSDGDMVISEGVMNEMEAISQSDDDILYIDPYHSKKDLLTLNGLIGNYTRGYMQIRTIRKNKKIEGIVLINSSSRAVLLIMSENKELEFDILSKALVSEFDHIFMYSDGNEESEICKKMNLKRAGVLEKEVLGRDVIMYYGAASNP